MGRCTHTLATYNSRIIANFYHGCAITAAGASACSLPLLERGGKEGGRRVQGARVLLNFLLQRGWLPSMLLFVFSDFLCWLIIQGSLGTNSSITVLSESHSTSCLSALLCLDYFFSLLLPSRNLAWTGSTMCRHNTMQRIVSPSFAAYPPSVSPFNCELFKRLGFLQCRQTDKRNTWTWKQHLFAKNFKG